MIKTILLITFTIATLVAFGQTVDTNFVDGRLYVKVEQSSSMDLANYNNSDPVLNQMMLDYQVSGMFQAFKTSSPVMNKIYRLEFANIQLVDNFITGLQALSYIEYAEKAPLFHLQFTPNDYSASEQYALELIEAENAWDIEQGSANVVVAIIDNGVNYNHEDIAPNRWENPGEIAGNGFDDDLNGYTDDKFGYDVADGDGDPAPPSNGDVPFVHGSHCAGIASARANNNTGVSGLGFNVSIMSVKATRDNTDGNTLSGAYEGVDYAISAGADIISMSFGSANSFLTFEVLVNEAQANGIMMVAAAGNDNTDEDYFPASYPYVFSVGATDQNDVRANFSNYGSNIDVMAPGVSIKSCFFQTTSSYGNLSGTSMSCPLVAGLAGLLMSYDSSLTVNEVKTFIRNGCDNIDAQNPDFTSDIGSGRINAFRSLQLAAGLSLEDLDTDNFTFSVYPNPSDDFFIFQPDQALPEPSELTLVDMSGKVALTESFGIVFPNTKLRVNHALLGSGVYIMNFTIGDFTARRRVVIQ